MRATGMMYAGRRGPCAVRFLAVALWFTAVLAGSAPAEDGDGKFREAMRQGAAHARKGEYPRALARFRQAKKLRPGDAEARYRLALTYNDLKAYATAEEEARKATVLDETYAPAWLVLGSALFYQDREAEAVPALEQALLLEPENEHTAYMLGRCHYFLGQRDRLLGDQFRAQAATTGDEEPVQRAQVADREAEGAFRKALQYFRRTLQLDPGYGPASFMEGCCFLELDLPDTARDSLQRALRSDPDNPEIHFRLGLCYLHSARYMDAERSFREALRLDRDHLGAHLYLGELFTNRLPDPEQAKLHFQRFLRDAPESHPARARVARLLQQNADAE
ncbi:MAG: tetratricopeptide repeat protein [Planctomycetota bacterium]